MLAVGETFNVFFVLQMEFTQSDVNETKGLAELIKKIDTLDVNYVNAISDDIYKFQPFFLSVLLGYRQDVSPVELEELMKVYFIIWESFKDRKEVRTHRITQELFERIEGRNFSMFKYAEGEQTASRQIIYESDLQNIQSNALLAAVLFRFNHQPALLDLNTENKTAILIGIKTFIECFELITKSKE